MPEFSYEKHNRHNLPDPCRASLSLVEIILREERHMNILNKLFNVGMKLNFSLLIIILGTSASFADFTGRYCELEGARTSSGESVTGECYFHSDQYAELDGARTSSGESVTGECYIYQL
jgi:hypothetical protein